MYLRPVDRSTPAERAAAQGFIGRLRLPSPEQCGKLWLRIRRNWQLYALLFLPLLWLVIFRYAPMYGAQIAFREYSPAFGIEGSPWVGLAHFERFFKSYYFKPVIVNTLVISFYSLLAGFPIPIILALSVNQVKMRLFRNSVQMITYAPHFISTVVIVGMLFQFLHPRVGFTASLANMLGLAPPNWMGRPGRLPSYLRLVRRLAGDGLWRHHLSRRPFHRRPRPCTKRRWVDGANRLQRIRYIDIPGLLPTGDGPARLIHRARPGSGL